GSASFDGREGDELSWLPLSFWDAFLPMINRWMKRGIFPEAMRSYRQVFIPKSNLDEGDADPSDLRPISIGCTFNRIISGAMLMHPSVQGWIAALVPDQMHGALKERSLEAGIVDLLEQWQHPNAVLLSLDMKKGFDFADVEHSLRVLQHYGFCEDWLVYLREVWQEQLRYSQLGPYVTREPEVVRRSLPQGDPLAPLAFCLLLVPAALDTARGQNVAQALFVDDRNLVVVGADSALAKQAEWVSWCEFLGLCENTRKAAFVARSRKDQQLLLEHVQPEFVKEQTRVLGVDFCRVKRRRHATHEARRARAACVLQRLARTPLPVTLKEKLYISRVASVAAWGCWLQHFRNGKEFGSKTKMLLQGHKSASRDLWELLQGHMVDLRFVGLQRSLAALGRGLLYWRRRGRQLGGGAWFEALREGLFDLGFSFAFGTFDHNVAGAFEYPWRPGLGPFKKWLATALHRLREAWRCQRWEAFLAAGRRGAEVCRRHVYDAELVKKARQAFATGGGDARTVLTGGAHSIMAYHAIQGAGPDELQSCPCCGAHRKPTSDHLAWHCTAFAAERPLRPADELAARMGWPVTGNASDDMAVLLHLCRVRDRVRRDFGLRVLPAGADH
ncbi:unnamed protein product, partial [Symbiodinium sp. KB8]